MVDDPLKRDNGNIGARALFEKFSACAHGFTAADAISAALNVLVNAMRQTYANRERAARAFDEATGKAKHILLEEHYHGDGSRRNVFPHTQEVRVEGVVTNKPTFMR